MYSKKPCVTRHDFSIESTASALIPGYVLALETIHNFYIITLTVPNKFEKTFNLNLLRSQVEENTSYNSRSIFRNFRTTIFQTENKKVCHSSKVHVQYFLLDWCFTYNFLCFLACSKYFVKCLWTFVFVPTRKSSATKFTARKELEWRWF